MSEKQMPQLDTNYPSNSKMSKEKKVEKIIQGNVKTRKKPLGKKIQETFITEDADTIRSYLLFDVVVPTVKDSILEVVRMLLWGGSGAAPTKKKGPYVSYNGYSTPSYKDNRKSTLDRRKQIDDFRDVIFETRGDAEQVLDVLLEDIESYGAATVADLYDLVGVTGSFTDNKYGWVDLSGASVSRVREGYMINLPKAIFID